MCDDTEHQAQQQHVALADEPQVYIGIGHLDRNQADAGDDEGQRATAACRHRAKLVGAVPRRHIESQRIRGSRAPAPAQLGRGLEQCTGILGQPPLECRSLRTARPAARQHRVQPRCDVPLFALRFHCPAAVIGTAAQQPPEHNEAYGAILHPHPENGVVTDVVPEGPALAEIRQRDIERIRSPEAQACQRRLSDVEDDVVLFDQAVRIGGEIARVRRDLRSDGTRRLRQ